MLKFQEDGKKFVVKKTYKSFIVGCGNIAGYSDDGKINDFTHAYAYNKNKNINLAGCMDINPERGKFIAENINCKTFDNYIKGVTDTKAEIISVCTPDNTHYEIVKDLLEIESDIKVIFLEKPACSSLDQMNHLISRSTERNIDIVVNHTRRFDNRYKEIKYNIARGIYGSLLTGFITYYSGWKHNGVHVIDTLSYIFDDTVQLNSIINRYESPYPLDPTIEGKLNFLKSPGIIHLFAFDEKYYQLFEFDLRFEKARLKIEDFGSRIILEKKEINNIGENVLSIQNNSFNNNEMTPIENAFVIIINKLKSNNKDLLKGYRLEDIKNTMNTIWSIEDEN